MLFLTRSQGQSIMIGDDVCITVVAAKYGQARIAIAAPKEIPVHREEIYQRIQHEKLMGETDDL